MVECCGVGRLAMHIPEGLFVLVNRLAFWNGDGWAGVSSCIHTEILADVLKEGQQCCGCCCSIFAELAVMEEPVSFFVWWFFFFFWSCSWVGCTYVNSFSVQTHTVLAQSPLLGRGKSSLQKIWFRM